MGLTIREIYTQYYERREDPYGFSLLIFLSDKTKKSAEGEFERALCQTNLYFERGRSMVVICDKETGYVFVTKEGDHWVIPSNCELLSYGKGVMPSIESRQDGLYLNPNQLFITPEYLEE